MTKYSILHTRMHFNALCIIALLPVAKHVWIRMDANLKTKVIEKAPGIIKVHPCMYTFRGTTRILAFMENYSGKLHIIVNYTQWHMFQ